MAGWLSSKLKEAEQFLQQIDQQAAESLGKPEKERFRAHQNISEEINGALSKKYKHPEDHFLPKPETTGRQRILGNKSDIGFQSSFSRPTGLAKFDVNQKRLNTTTMPEVKDPKVQSKKQSLSVPRGKETFENVGRDDWTELLSTPNLNLVSSQAHESSVGSSDFAGSSSIRGGSSKASLSKDRNGGYLQQGVEFPEITFLSLNQSEHVSSQASHAKLLNHSSETDRTDSEMSTFPRNFRDKTLIRQLDLAAGVNSQVDRDLDVTSIRDTSSITSNAASTIDLISETNQTLPITNSASVSKEVTLPMLGSSFVHKRNHHELMIASGLMKNETIGTVGKDGPTKSTQHDIDKLWQSKDLNFVREDSPGLAMDLVKCSAEKPVKVDSTNENGHESIGVVGQSTNLEESPSSETNKPKENSIATRNSSLESSQDSELKFRNYNLASKEIGSLVLPSEVHEVKVLEAHGELRGKSDMLKTTERLLALSESDARSSESGTETESGLESESEDEEMERQKSVHKQRIARRKEIAAAKAAAAEAAIREREDFVGKLEREKVTLERILADREEQQGREAAELRLSTAEVLQALELEKQHHSSTRMKALAKESQLENQNAELAKCLGAVQWELEEQIAEVLKIRSIVEAKEVIKAELERRLARLRHNVWSGQQSKEGKLTGSAKTEDHSFEEEQGGLWRKIEQRQIQVKELERKLGDLKDSRRVPTQTVIDLENHLTQLTDHLIQKQAQVEALSTEKATLVFRLETVSNTLQEERVKALSRASRNTMGIARNSDWNNLDLDMEYGLTRPYSLKNKSFPDDVEDSTAAVVGNFGSLPFSPVIRQLDAVFSVGSIYLRRHRWAQIFASAYVIGLHLWVMFIFIMHSKNRKSFGLQDVAIPRNISDNLGGSNVTNFI